MNIVFILGAGASASTGAPLMSTFLDRAASVESLAPSPSPAYDLMDRGLKELEAAAARSTIDLQNIESVFTAFEMANLFQALGGLGTDEIQGLPNAIRQVIIDTLERSVKFNFHTGDAAPPESYEQFSHALSELRSPLIGHGNRVSLVTFNYDLGLDFALNAQWRPMSYCFDGVAIDKVNYMKLHGSLNWLHCRCREVTVIPFESATWTPAERGAHRQFMRLPRSNQRCVICGEIKETLIVPPTWDKMQHYQRLAPVWRSAASVLSEAEAIGVFGYSLPQTDQWFRLLFALGTMRGSRLRKFWVFDPEKSGALQLKYQELLGPMLQGRYEYTCETFPEAVDHIVQRFANLG